MHDPRSCRPRPRRARRRIAAALLLVLSLWPAAGGAGSAPEDRGPDWQLQERVREPDTGYVLYKRRPAASAYDAYRLEAVVDASPALVAAAARADMADPAVAPPNTEKTILRDEGDEVVVYTYADLPLVADRDVTTRARQSVDAPTGTYRLEWQATAEEGPVPRPGVVRLVDSSGAWTFSPLSGERTRVVYESHSDLAGSIPAWVINPLMTGAVVDGLTRLRARVAGEAKFQRPSAAASHDAAATSR